MIEMTTSTAARAVDGVLSGADTTFVGVSTDSRTLAPGQLFVALRGPNFDGHDWLPQAASAGAVAGLVEHPSATDLPLITVDETRVSLGRLASNWRDKFDLPVIGITGSAGKTTVKEMVGHIMHERGTALVTQGNLNNDIGVPLTLFRLDARVEAAVIEMGANKVGDIAYLAQLAKPKFGVVTLCAPAHLEGFGDIETVAKTKGELFENLPPDGTAVINIEDDYATLWKTMAGNRNIVTFGDSGDVQARNLRLTANGSSFELVIAGSQVQCSIQLSGIHNVRNALAAAAISAAAGATVGHIVAGLAKVRAVSGRLDFRSGIHGSRIIDDSYNANPASMRAALEVLAAQPGEKWLVMGDMGELGPPASALHVDVSKQARDAGVSRLFAIGALSRNTCAAFGSKATHFETVSDLVGGVKDAMAHYDGSLTILIKASRSMALDQAADMLAAREEASC